MQVNTQLPSGNALICHNDKALLAKHADWLLEAGYNPICVTSPEQANTCLENMHIALMLVAQHFAECDGLHFCASLNAIRRAQNTVTLLLLNEEQEDIIDGLEDAGVDDYLPVQLGKSGFRHRIKQAMKRAKPLQSKGRSNGVVPLRTRSETAQCIQSVLRNAQNTGFAALLVIDIDNFRRVNSSFDFACGDRALAIIEARLSQVLRSDDCLLRRDETTLSGSTITRLGGDEFVVFIDNLRTPDDAQCVAKRCLQSIHEPLELAGQSLVLSASIGVALTTCEQKHERNHDADKLMQRAERAMYAAKKSGGNTLKYYQSEMAQDAGETLLIENALRTALSEDQLTLHYQPQVDGATGEVTSMEVLCRWFHPTLGQIAPDRFIPIAEETGLIVPIGEWVLRSACFQAKQWLNRGLNLRRIAVNVSAYQFFRPDFVESTIAILVETGLPASCLELELTESLIMSNAEENIRKLETLKRLGISLAVDDFGTGYSSLSYLKSLPIDTLKIDRSFIANLQDDDKDHAIVSAILSLAAKLDLSVVAEGVEQKSQIRFLRDNRCAVLQGYYFSAAKPASEAAQMLGKSLAAA